MLYSDFPRWVGSPEQYTVRNQEQWERFIRLHNGFSPCYTSHNAHPSRTSTLVRYIPYDFDAKLTDWKIENTLADALALRDWAKEKGLLTVHVFTGGGGTPKTGGGFHSYIALKPRECNNTEGLRAVYRAIQGLAVEEAKLRSSDPAIMGDYRRILRIVNCIYVNGKTGIKTGLYSVEIPPDMLERASMPEIVEYAHAPHPIEGQIAPLEDVQDMALRLDLKRIVLQTKQAEASSPTIPYRPDIVPEFIKEIVPRPCIHQEVMTHNPDHKIRFELVAHLWRLNYTKQEILSLVTQVAEKAAWVDRNPSMTKYQIRHITHRLPMYRETSCSKIRAKGFCVGKVCADFKKQFPGE